MMEWISVNDGLPELRKGLDSPEIVIVSGIDDDGERYVYWAEVNAYWSNKNKEDIFSVPGWSKMNVTHWMPLPQPPKQ